MTPSTTQDSRFRRPIRLVLDFDGTITQKDTMHLVAQCGYDSYESHPERRLHARSNPQLPPWQYFVDAYMRDYGAHKAQWQPQKEDRTTVDQEIAWLRSLRPVEEASADRVIASGLFDCVDHMDMSQAVIKAMEEHSLAIRPGLTSLLTMIYAWNTIIEDSRFSSPALQIKNAQIPCLQIVSVNWSRLWIAAALEAHLSSSELANLVVSNAMVVANEIPSLDGKREWPQMPRWNLVSEHGDSAIKCRTSDDKLEQMTLCLKRSNVEDNSKPLVVYVGDSATDLECLLAADVGICMRDTPMGSGQRDLADLCVRVDIAVEQISEATLTRLSQAKAPQLWWASDFEEVAAWINAVTAGEAKAASHEDELLSQLRGLRNET